MDNTSLRREVIQMITSENYFSNFSIECKKCRSKGSSVEIRPVTVILDDDKNVTADSIEIFCNECGEIEYSVEPK